MPQKKFIFTLLFTLCACQASVTPNANLMTPSSPQFDGVIPTENPAHALPGSVSVIYRNAHEVRVDKTNNRITTRNPEDALAIEKILTAHGLKSATDTAFGRTEAELQENVRSVSDAYGIEAPDRRSVHLYQFPPEADTQAIAAELRKLPFVRSAYMTPSLD
ncbi:MAG: hypothetical protein ACO1RX_02320 [Candidatus Sericytochromatia bacterium]